MSIRSLDSNINRLASTLSQVRRLDFTFTLGPKSFECHIASHTVVLIVNHDQNKLAILNIITYVGSIYNSFIISSFKKRKKKYGNKQHVKNIYLFQY